jgi:1-phosphofructokinase family hexose kinase
VLAICPNPTIDRLVILDTLVPGVVDRVRENRAYPAGKSVSAARGCLANGAHPRVHVLLPTTGSEWYLDTVRSEGMDVTSHPCPGAVRESIIVLEDDGRVTVLNGPGARVSETMWDDFVQSSTAGLRPGEWVICSGSFPPGVGPEALARLVAAITATGARLALDTGPAWMPLALRGPALPALITPNLAEAEAILTGETSPEATGVGDDALARAAGAAAGLQERGIPHVVVTAGSAGLAWATRQGAGVLPGRRVKVRNPIGAGDAFLGGLVSRLEAGLDFAAAARWGMATSCAAIEQWSPGGAPAHRVAHFHDLITAS